MAERYRVKIGEVALPVAYLPTLSFEGYFAGLWLGRSGGQFEEKCREWLRGYGRTLEVTGKAGFRRS